MITALLALFGVILIDLVFSGDNAIVIGALAASLPAEQRQKAIISGMAIAVVARIILSLLAVYLLMIPGVQLIGGLLLLYVAYGLYNDIRDDGEANGSNETKHPKTFASAMIAITMADISMSLDNVLAVASTAKDHWVVLIIGLLFSVAFMTFAATIVAKLIEKYKWISWVGFGVIVLIAGKMIYHGVPELISWFHN